MDKSINTSSIVFDYTAQQAFGQAFQSVEFTNAEVGVGNAPNVLKLARDAPPICMRIVDTV